MRFPFTAIAYWSWLVLFLVWMFGYRDSKRAINAPNLLLQIPVTALVIFGFVLLFNPRIYGLGAPVTPRNAVLGMIGLALDLAGVAFAIWARLTLGSNWSGMVMTTKEGHELVQTGPYAIVRHPIYAGFLLAMLGTALTIGTTASYLGFVASLVAFMIRVMIEDRLMRDHFGKAHEAYQQRTKRLIPYVW
ncbi:MAG TPA: isoprenylcysteine carboxylmethyltransferase family protein [Xanthobacteraceae bacterium]|nr:isoprenylcysteine carboxylmethyltransferase family protein [Xanthobacteraceae bacterium]